jgi:hypothetical protein
MMKLARSRRRAAFALAGLAALCGGAARAADDKSTISSVAELFGYSSDPTAASIDYRERPKLVLPPKVGDLPPPREAERPAGWPSDTTTTRNRSTDRYARVPNAPPPEKKPGLLERLRGPRPDYAPGTDDEPGFFQRVLMRKRADVALSSEEPSRRMLTEPPSGYRKPTTDLNAVSDPEFKKSSWWNPLSHFGKEDDRDPVAQPGAPTPAQQAKQSGGDSGSWFRLPHF